MTHKFILFLILLGIILLISLGVWQLSRGYTKQNLLNAAKHASTLSPLNEKDLLLLPVPQLFRFHKVRCSIPLDMTRPILLDNVTQNNRIGYKLYFPALLNTNTILLIEQGWIAQGRYRHSLVELPKKQTNQYIEGYLDLVYRNPFLSRAMEQTVVQWPLILQTLDLILLNDIFDKQVYPMVVRQNLAQQNLVSFSPQRHFGYAFQWFALASILLGYAFFYFWNVRKKHENKKS